MARFRKFSFGIIYTKSAKSFVSIYSIAFVHVERRSSGPLFPLQGLTCSFHDLLGKEKFVIKFLLFQGGGSICDIGNENNLFRLWCTTVLPNYHQSSAVVFCSSVTDRENRFPTKISQHSRIPLTIHRTRHRITYR